MTRLTLRQRLEAIAREADLTWGDVADITLAEFALLVDTKRKEIARAQRAYLMQTGGWS